MRKEPVIVVHSSKNYDFQFGACAGIAISQMFNIPKNHFNAICTVAGLKYDEGLTFAQCNKLIKRLSKSYGAVCKYHPNLFRLEYGQLINLFTKGKYIYMFDEHLSYTENGLVYDSYLHEMPLRIDLYKQFVPTGWWDYEKITDNYGKLRL